MSDQSALSRTYAEGELQRHLLIREHRADAEIVRVDEMLEQNGGYATQAGAGRLIVCETIASGVASTGVLIWAIIPYFTFS